MPEPKLPISAFIIALDEADRIAASIRSVRDWVDEVIVIDSGSTDGTQSVAEAEGARVLFHAWEGYGRQKRFGEDQCRHDWLLNLDADEAASTELAEEIRVLFAQGTPKHAAYTIRIREILPTEHHLPRFGRSVSPVRLYDRKCGRYAKSPVHDRVEMQHGGIGHLRHPFWHRSVRSLTHSVFKIDRYSTMQAQDLCARKKRMHGLRLRILLAFPLGFMKAYISRGYILKGMPGFINAVMYGFSRFLRLAKVYERMRNTSSSPGRGRGPVESPNGIPNVN